MLLVNGSSSSRRTVEVEVTSFMINKKVFNNVQNTTHLSEDLHLPFDNYVEMIPHVLIAPLALALPTFSSLALVLRSVSKLWINHILQSFSS